MQHDDNRMVSAFVGRPSAFDHHTLSAFVGRPSAVGTHHSPGTGYRVPETEPGFGIRDSGLAPRALGRAGSPSPAATPRTARSGHAHRSAIAVVASIVLGGVVVSAQAPKVAITPKPAEKKVEVTVDGKPFTTYMWPDSLEKPVLYPVVTAGGTTITRGFPPGPNERQDHPHHVGLWFNYGDVNGFDFWNNSDAIKPEQKAKMGSVEHREVVKAESRGDHAVLQVKADWVAGDGKTLLNETTTFTFRAAANGARMIDRVTTLAAAPGTGTVKMTDNKEGMLGLRVVRPLEDPAEKSGEFKDAAGRVTKMADMDTSGVTGQYLSSEGKVGKDVWGTRGAWTKLSGSVNGKDVTVAILDAPGNPGYPTYWHARGYGLFAANPLGQAALSEGKDTLNFSITEGKPATFRYRILLLDSNASAAEMQKYAQAWASTSGGSPSSNR